MQNQKFQSGVNVLETIYGVMSMATDSRVPIPVRSDICENILSLTPSFQKKLVFSFGDQQIDHVIKCNELEDMWVSFRLKNKNAAILFPLTCSEIQRSISNRKPIQLESCHISLFEMMFSDMINNLPHAHIRFNKYLHLIRIYNKVIIMEEHPADNEETIIVKRKEITVEKNY